MTASELLEYLNNTYGTAKPWPKSIEVDLETYGNCVHHIIDNLAKGGTTIKFKSYGIARGYITIGLDHGGPLFRNVELVLKRE